MIDMTETIKPKSDQLNADDLIGTSKTITITNVRKTGAADQPVAVFFDGDNGKPYKPCLSMRRVMVIVWGKDAKEYVGKSMTLIRDDEVVFGGMKVGGIRISHMSDMKAPLTMVLTASKAKRAPYTVKPLAVSAPPKISAETKAAGEAASMAGVETYKAWLATLSPEIKETVRPYHQEWQSVAKAADAEPVIINEEEKEAE